MILEIQDTLVSDEVFTQKFICNLDACKGACCIEGDRGAPIELSEIEAIASQIENIKPFMDPKGIELYNAIGFHEGLEIDDAATTCLETGECVFVYRENGQLGCAIEKAYNMGAIPFNKPISCHLYPIRLGQINEMTTVNYHEWDICSAACQLGKANNVAVYQFLKAPLIRRFGEAWYSELEEVYQAYQSTFNRS